jgi:hypothetical protein
MVAVADSGSALTWDRRQAVRISSCSERLVRLHATCFGTSRADSHGLARLKEVLLFQTLSGEFVCDLGKVWLFTANALVDVTWDLVLVAVRIDALHVGPDGAFLLQYWSERVVVSGSSTRRWSGDRIGAAAISAIIAYSLHGRDYF